jgi:hypothetical protein
MSADSSSSSAARCASPDSESERPWRSRRLRAGTAVHSLLTTLCGAAALLTAAAVLDPASLQAGSPDRQPDTTRNPQEELTEFLSILISQSERVVAINPAQGERGCEVLLWFADTADRGNINASELTLIRHSPLFQTLMVYSMPTNGGSDAGRPGSAASASPSRAPSGPTSVRFGTAQAIAGAALSESDVVAPGFTDRWRAMSSVEARMIARGISDLSVEEAGHPDVSQLSLLHLHLTWQGDSVDGAREVSAVVAAGRRNLAEPAENRAAGVTR